MPLAVMRVGVHKPPMAAPVPGPAATCHIVNVASHETARGVGRTVGDLSKIIFRVGCRMSRESGWWVARLPRQPHPPRPAGTLMIMENGRGTVPGGTAGEVLVRDHGECVASILSRPATELRLMWDLGNIHLASKGCRFHWFGCGSPAA